MTLKKERTYFDGITSTGTKKRQELLTRYVYVYVPMAVVIEVTVLPNHLLEVVLYL